MGERRRQAEGGRRRPGGAQPMGDLGAQDQGGGSAAEEHAGGDSADPCRLRVEMMAGWDSMDDNI